MMQRQTVGADDKITEITSRESFILLKMMKLSVLLVSQTYIF